MIAHLTFAGGGLRLPARTPYDRQQLIEHVHACMGRTPQVHVRIDRAAWLIERPDNQHTLVCRGCARQIRRAVCRRRRTAAAFCVDCALQRPHLCVALLAELPAGTILRDVEAHYAYGTELISWTRWPQATPAEIIDDIHLQRRFAPVLTWRCAEIRVPPATNIAEAPRPRPAKMTLPYDIAPNLQGVPDNFAMSARFHRQ